MIELQWLNKLLQWLRTWPHLKDVSKEMLALTQKLSFPKFYSSVLTHNKITEKPFSFNVKKSCFFSLRFSCELL